MCADKLQDRERSIPHVEDVVPHNVLVESPEESVRLLLYLSKTFNCGREPPREVLKMDLFQALEDYRISEEMLARASEHYTTSVTDCTNNNTSLGIEGISDPRLSNAPEESTYMDSVQPCRWVDMFTKQICDDFVPVEKQAILAHLNSKHNVVGLGREEIECRWAIFPSDSSGVCGKRFQQRNTLRHIAAHLHLRASCTHCGKEFARSDLVTVHIRNEHQAQEVSLM